jgi:hypothetical protein
LVPPL